MFIRRIIFSLLVSLSISNCTVVKVSGLTGEPSYNFSLVSRVLPDAPVYVSSTTYGVHLDKNEFILGYGSSWKVIIPRPEGCSVVVIVERAQEMEAVMDLLKSSGNNLEQVCVLEGE